MNYMEPQPAYRPASSDDADEIDLLELFAVGWQGRWLIIATTAVIGLAAFIFLKFMPSVYQVETTLGSTSQYNIQALQPSTLQKGGIYQVSPLKAESVYATGLAHIRSPFVQKTFWEARTGEPLTRRVPGAVLTANDLAFQSFVDALRIEPEENLSKLYLDTEDPTEGVQLLSDYVKFVDRYTIEQFVSQLKAGYQSSLARLIEDSETLYEREKIKLADERVRLEEAYRLADKLGIRETPYEQVQNVELSIMDSRFYLLGTAVLGAEINALKVRQEMPLEAFVPLLRDMEHWRGQIESDLRKLESANVDKNVRTFVAVSPPESSLDPVKPNKLLIFIASVFGAGMLGVVLVFIRHGIRTYQAR